MVKIVPAKTPEMENTLKAAHPVQDGYTCLYRATEDERETGWFAVRNDGEALTITQMEVLGCPDDTRMSPDDRYFAELMMRAAASYAINRMIFTLRCAEPRYRNFLKSFGFTENDMGQLEVEIAKLIHGCGAH